VPPISYRSYPYPYFSGHLESQALLTLRRAKNPTDISIVPDAFAAYPDEAVDQSNVLTQLTGTPDQDDEWRKEFGKIPVRDLKLSKLKSLYEKRDKAAAADLLSVRNTIVIDDKFRISLGGGRVIMNTDDAMIDYHLTVGNCVGFSPLLPNAASSHRFCFDMDLKKPYVAFKGKHAMLGFDPAGSMLFLGHCQNEEIFLAMAPREFLRGRTQPCAPGQSSASSLMTKAHYRQMVMMIVHFLARLPERAFFTVGSVYDQDLHSSTPRFHLVTDTLYVFRCILSFRLPTRMPTSTTLLIPLFDRSEGLIKLNFEDLKLLDSLIVEGYDDWVKEAPDHWKLDCFLKSRRPIVVTSRFGQNARIAALGNETQEAEAWELERDYSKLSFITFALATSIK